MNRTNNHPRRKRQQRKGKGYGGQPVRAIVNRPALPFEDRRRVKLMYVENFTRTGVIADTYAFSGNSVYDPNATGTGHQPRGFDQYGALYEKYRVLSSQITVRAINGNSVSGVYCVITPTTNVLSATIPHQEVREYPYSKTVKTPLAVASRVGYSLKVGMSTTEILGLNKMELNSDNHAALVTTNPASRWWWHVTVASVDLTTTIAISYSVEIEYQVEFYDRTEFVSSYQDKVDKLDIDKHQNTYHYKLMKDKNKDHPKQTPYPQPLAVKIVLDDNNLIP
jgi:hypothetical protein